MSGRSTGLTTTNRRPSYESHTVRSPCTDASPSLTLRLLPAGMRYHASAPVESRRDRFETAVGQRADPFPVHQRHRGRCDTTVEGYPTYPVRVVTRYRASRDPGGRSGHT